MVRPFLIASGLLAVGFCLASAPGASGADQQETGPGDSDRELPSPVSREARAAAKLVGRSVWGVVPDAPARKSEVTPGMVRGAAVAVGPGTLLASCRAVAGRERVGLVRLNKYRVARVAGSDPVADVCVLEVTDVPLNVAAGFRSLGDLRPGEPAYTLTGQVGGGAGLAEGRVAGRGDGGAGPRFEAEVALPLEVLSAVLFDGDGNLLGLGVPTDAGRVVAGPVTPLSAPGLANRDRGDPTAADVPPASPVPVVPSRPLPVEAEPAVPSSQAQAARSERPPVDAGLRATLTTPRGTGAVFRAEEPVTVVLETSAEAFAYCYYADGAGRVSRVFPNRFRRDARVGESRRVEIPGAAAGFELVPDRPGTAEELSCLVAEREAGPELAGVVGAEDLVPLPVRSLDEVAAAFRVAAGGFVETRLTVEVAP